MPSAARLFQRNPMYKYDPLTALLDLCRDRRHLGGTPALTAVLHTWTRQMLWHPHVHFIASGGGLAPDGSWREAGPKFLVPVRALSVLFAARFRDLLRGRHPALFAEVPASVWRRPWVVHSKPVGSGEKALAYLARYVFRVALADSAILRHDGSEVVFRYRDGPTGEARTARVPPHEFIRRFLQHVLPKGFRKVRHCGLNHSSRRKALRLLQTRLALARELPLPPADKPAREPMPAPACRHCKTQMRAVEQLRPAPAPSPHSTARGPPTA